MHNQAIATRMETMPPGALRAQLTREITRVEIMVLPVVKDLGRAAGMTYALIDGDVRMAKNIVRFADLDQVRTCLHELEMVMPTIRMTTTDTPAPRGSAWAGIKARTGGLFFDAICKVFL